METNLTLDKAVTIASSHEAADKNVHILKNSAEQEVKIHKILQQSSPRAKIRKKRKCFRCGDQSHIVNECKHTHSKCTYCKKVGHIAKVCLKREKQGDSSTSNQLDTEEEAQWVHTMQTSEPPIYLKVDVNNVPVTFQLDTGAGPTIINYSEFQNKFGNLKLQSSDMPLRSYTKTPIKVMGVIDVHVEYNGQSHTLPLVVVDGQGPPLFGRKWLRKIKLPWSTIFNLESSCHSAKTMENTDSKLKKILDENKKLFNEEPGLLRGFEAHLDIKENAQPIFCKARPVPFAIKSKIEEELQRLETEGIIQKVVHSDWAAPVVPVIKPSGKLRLCGDFKVTVNKVAVLDRYPLPRIDELFANLSGGTKFSKLDLSQAYHQIALDESSCKLATLNTHYGLFQYRRLPYGVSSAVSLFQRVIENLLKGIP